MLGKAHITIGMASALTVMMPESMPAALPVITGAAAGCLICDIDCDSPREKSDTSRYRLLAVIIVVIALLADRAYGLGLIRAGSRGASLPGGELPLSMWQTALPDGEPPLSMWQTAAQNGAVMVCAGIAVFALTLTFANISSHRGFSHSLLAMALEAGALWLIFPQTVTAFVTAFASHLVLDLTNKKPVRILYPVKKGFCLGLYYADRLADKVCAAIGGIWLIVMALTLIL